MRSGRHWLPTRARVWLDEKSREWWFRGLDARCRDRLELYGREEELRRLVEDARVEYVTKHAERAVDERAKTHLQAASLALATYRKLLPWYRGNQTKVLEVIKEQMGERTSPMVRTLLRLTNYVSTDKYQLTTRRLELMLMDYGLGFQSQFSKSDEAAEVRIYSCFYHDIFAEEGAPELTKCCCCSIDRMWFDWLDPQKHGLEFESGESLAQGDKQCIFRIQKVHNT